MDTYERAEAYQQIQANPEEIEKLRLQKEKLKAKIEKQRHQQSVLALAEKLLFLPSEPNFPNCLALAEAITDAAKAYIDKN